VDIARDVKIKTTYIEVGGKKELSFDTLGEVSKPTMLVLWVWFYTNPQI